MVTLIIVKTWSRLLISNYAWHLPGCCSLLFLCLLLGRVIEDRCLHLPKKGGAWHTGGLPAPLCAWRTCCFPKRRDQRVFLSNWAGLKECHRTGCPLPNTSASAATSPSITTAALQGRSLSLERSISSRILLKCYLHSPYWRTGELRPWAKRQENLTCPSSHSISIATWTRMESLPGWG